MILQWLLGVYAKDTNQGEYDELFGNSILTAINSETGLEQNAALSTGKKNGSVSSFNDLQQKTLEVRNLQHLEASFSQRGIESIIPRLSRARTGR